MIVFGSAVTSQAAYRRYAERGIALAREPDSLTLPRGGKGSIFSNYNAILDEVSGIDGLEALVLLHQDAEIVDPQFCAKLRSAMSDPEVGVVGCVGSIGVRSIAWWEGSVAWASFIHRYTELGGGDFPSLTWNESERQLCPARRGRHGRRLRAGPFALGGAEHPLRRIARPASAWLRLRLLPTGPRGRS